MAERSRRTVVLAAAAAVVLAGLLSLVWLGLEQVPDGQVLVRPDGEGGVAAVWEPGWHWRAPWSNDPLPLPRERVEAQPEVAVTTGEGARIVLDLEGRFAVPAGSEPRWVEAAGFRPFVEGLAEVARRAVEPRVRSGDPAAVFADETLSELAAAVQDALTAAGAEAVGLRLTAPVEKNPVAVAVARNKVARLAHPTGLKVLVVGWDGADWLMMRPLLDAGRLPNVAKLIAGGVSGELRSQEPLLSPLIWTTIATGKPVAEHGIADFLVQDPGTGSLVPISSASRKVHALWSLLPAFGLSTDAVAWWATWPAEPIQGTMITDRVAYQLFDYAAEREQDPAGKVHPPEAWPRVADLLVSADEVPFADVRRFIDVPPDELAERWNDASADQRQKDPANHLRKILATTRSYHAVALDLLRRQADLTLVYYEGTDTVGHLFARYLPPRLPEVSEDDVRRYGQALPRFYEYVDGLLGELLAAADDDTVVMLISDHGFFTGRARPKSDPADWAGGAPQWHRLYGILVGDGPGIGRGEVEGASIFDVAPTVLAALGLPVPEDMPGRPLPELLPPAARSAVPQVSGRLASYEILPRARPEAARTSAAEDEERLRELVALGYISQAALDQRLGTSASGDGDDAPAAGPEAAAPAPGTADDRSSGELQGLVTEAYNLGRIAQRAGRYDEAERHYRDALARAPSFGMAWASLAQVAALRGDHSAAFELLVQGFSKSNTLPRSGITGLVDEAKSAGRLDDAARVLESMRGSLSGDAAYHAAWGLLRESRGDLHGALADYDRALEIDPLDGLSVEQKVSLLRRLGREGEARDFLTRSFRRATSVSAMNQVAVVALRQRWPADAERLLREVLESDPGNPGVLANLAAALGQQGKMVEAAQVMRQAVERDPSNAGNYFNLGAMLAAQGRPGEALESFESALDRGLKTPRVYVAAAKMRFQLGDAAGAERDLRQALAIEPSHQEARELLDILRRGGGG
jgi:tetratricopeptide (TPR) repeat protein